MSLGIGDTLRDARRRVGCSLADAAAATRVRESYLAAIEQEDFAGLGGDVYVRGFIASYARYLRLDPAPLLDAYRTHREGRGAVRPATGQIPGAAVRRERPAGAAVLLLLVVVIVVALLAFTLRGGEDSALAMVADVAHAG